MQTVTASPEPDHDDVVDIKAENLLRYAYRKSVEAEKRGNLLAAAFWTGFRRSFRRRWYGHKR